MLLLNHIEVTKKDAVATGFLCDIVVVFPMIFYFLVIKPLKLKKWRMLLVFTCCCTIAYLILPAHQREYIIQLRKLIFVAELCVIIYCLARFRQIRIVFNQLQADFPDIAYNLYKSMAQVLGDTMAVKLLASELAVLRYALFAWKKPRMIIATAKYSVHKESGYAALFGVILAVGVIEIIAFHFLLHHFSKAADVIVTFISFYSMIFIVGDLSAVLKSPVLILGDRLLLRIGLRWRILVNITDITSVQKIKDDFEADKDCFIGGIMKSSVNVLLTFHTPVHIERLYRKPVTITAIAISIDEADKFIAQLDTFRHSVER